MTILVDSDGILADLLKTWLDLCYLQFGVRLQKSDIKTWEIHESVPESVGRRIYDCLGAPGLYERLDPLPGAKSAIKAFREAGHEVICVTASAKHPQTAADKLDWLRREFDFSRKEVFIGHRKELIKGDVFIDDSPENLSKYQAAWPNAHVLTIAYPYSENLPVSIKRFQSYYDTTSAWNQITEYVLSHVQNTRT